MIPFLSVFLLVMPGLVFGQLSLDTAPGRVPTLLMDGRPVLAYGPSPQNILTYLPRGNGNDYEDWVAWAEQYGIRNARSYPPSTIVAPPALNLFERAAKQPDKFDLTRFNDAYFQALRKACQRFKQAGIVVHLQLWQAVYWKKAWRSHYYNPVNNINPDISRHAGHQEFSTTVNPHLVSHQIEYIHRILDATADIGNVFYDVMNEIGNGTANDREWAEAMVNAIVDWESQHGIDVLLTLNDEGGLRLDDFSLEHPQLDFIIKDLGRYDEHRETQQRYGKPTVSVRNIDWNHAQKKRFYFFGRYNLENNADPELQTRGRKYWWRMYMAGVAAAGGYADSTLIDDRPWVPWFVSKVLARLGQPDLITFERQASYRQNTLAETVFQHFRRFVERTGQPLGLAPSEGLVKDHPAANSYVLQNNDMAILYLESPNGVAGHHYADGTARIEGLTLSDGAYEVLIFFPANGREATVMCEVRGGRTSISLPAFQDDLALLIR
jgi:hypothetical protein